VPLFIAHHADYDARFAASHRFPMRKYSALMETLRGGGIAQDENVVSPEPALRDGLCLAHDAAYVDQVLACAVPPVIEREIGFPVDHRVSLRARLASAGTLLAARLALKHGVACNAAGGSHHARHAQGAGFCTFNDVAFAARTLLAEGAIGRALVVDCDVHQGDGTAEIFAGDESVFTFSIHCSQNYPVRKRRSHLDVALVAGTRGEEYLEALREVLPRLLDAGRPDIVFYNAGVDVHRDDKLGKLKLDDKDILERDRSVVGFFRDRGIAVCGVLGGGYSDDVEALAARHALLFKAAAEFSG
jgi:acetoin utilization deacetylase AcuC-like enzyme